MENRHLREVNWRCVRMLSVDELRVSLLLTGDNEPIQLRLTNCEEMDRVVKAWFVEQRRRKES